MKQKSKVREYSEYKKVLVFQWFFLLERLPLMDARAAINGIQEVSGSIPLISTRKLTKKQKKSVKSYDFTDFFLHSIFKLLWEKATVLELYLNWPIHAM